MSSTKKGNAWYFGMKAHVGVDLDSGVVHTLEASTAKVHDSRKLDDLLHGDEQAVFGELPGLRHRFEQPLATAMSAASGRRRSAPRARSGA
jgi:IS5 family transposase